MRTNPHTFVVWDRRTPCPTIPPVQLFSHERTGPGTYRLDCSGFVSWVWGIKPAVGDGGARTFEYEHDARTSLYYWSIPIHVEELRRFDILIRHHHHVVLFDEWIVENEIAYVWEMAHHNENQTLLNGFYHHALGINDHAWETRRFNPKAN